METQELDMLSTTNDPIQHCTQHLYNNDEDFPAAEHEPTKNQEETKILFKEVSKDICASSHTGQTGINHFLIQLTNSEDSLLKIPANMK